MYGNWLSFLTISQKNVLKHPRPGNMTFLQNISMLWEFVHSETLGVAQFSINSKSVRKGRCWELSCAFHICSVIWEFTHPMLRELYGSLLHEIFKKLIILECFCFSIFFPYCGNSLFPCFGSCMDFDFTRQM